jgi:hypothetical protein
MVCLPKTEGGLCILKLKTQNETMLLKHWDKFFNRENIPWVNLVWEKYYRFGKLPNHVLKGFLWSRDLLKILDSYKGLAAIYIQDVWTCNFWVDLWGQQVPKFSYPELYSFTKHKAISLVIPEGPAAAESPTFVSSSHLNSCLITCIQCSIGAIQTSTHFDWWTYIWGSHTFFSDSKVYKVLIDHLNIQPVFN